MKPVIQILTPLFVGRYGCEPEDVCMAATLDDLNIAPHERRDMAAVLEELYDVSIETDVQDGWETVEDIVATVEDEINRREMSV